MVHGTDHRLVRQYFAFLDKGGDLRRVAGEDPNPYQVRARPVPSIPVPSIPRSTSDGQRDPPNRCDT